MQPNTIRTRGVKFAFLFGPPRFVGRDEAAKLYGCVCDKLSHDDLTFRYSTTEAEAKPTSRGFAINLARKEGRGGFGIIVTHKGGNEPIRVLFDYGWPPSMPHVEELFDSASAAVFDSLEGEWQKVLAETRIRAECAVRGQDALSYIRERLICVSSSTIESFGTPLAFASIRLDTSSSGDTDDAIAGPARQLTVEVLQEDRKSVYLELVSQWTQYPEIATEVDITKSRPFNANPTDYVKDSYEFLCARVHDLAGEEGGS